MPNEFDDQMKINLICVSIIICSVLLIVIGMLSFITTWGTSNGSAMIAIALIDSSTSVLLLPCAYKIVHGNRRAWIIAIILSAIMISSMCIINYTFNIPIIIVIAIIIVLLLLPITRKHCGVTRS